MNRRNWLRLTITGTLSGLTGCASMGGGAGGGDTIQISAATKRRLSSAGAAGYGVWQGGRMIDSLNPGAELGSLSLTKSIAALALTRAVAEGWLSFDGSLTDVIPEWRDDAAKSRITVRMLVNQTAGFAPSPGPLYRGKIQDKGRVAIALPLVHAPGTRFRYGPACWEILAEVLHRKLSADGSTLEKFIDRVTGRIGLSSRNWRKDGKGRYYLSTGAEYGVRELGKLGHTLGKLARGLNDAGLDAGIFRDLASPRGANPMFGAGIWWNRNASKAGAAAIEPERLLDGVHEPAFWSRACLSTRAAAGWLAVIGSGGKRVYVLPDKDIVIARLGRAYGWHDGALLDGLKV
jgi:CubicO group peptidase (beta-lactamase class C family)